MIIGTHATLCYMCAAFSSGILDPVGCADYLFRVNFETQTHGPVMTSFSNKRKAPRKGTRLPSRSKYPSRYASKYHLHASKFPLVNVTKRHPLQPSPGNSPPTPPPPPTAPSERMKRNEWRKPPDHYKRAVQAALSPSQLSFKSLTEYYKVGANNFPTADDVFRSRGYKKLDKIDEGAFGIVSKAMRVSDRTLVAIKEVDLRKKRAKRIEEMKRELFVLQKIDSSSVVKLIEHFVINQTLVIIMELCAGSNLTSYLKEKSITELESMRLFKQMATSIKVLHRKGIAHRDVKLNNFLLDSTRRIVKICDFGLSVVSYRPARGIMMAKTYCGTEPYMAPELLRRNSLGARTYNPLYADIWSLGVCLFAMLTRTFPFKMQASQTSLLQAQTTSKWRFPRNLRDTLSEELKDLIWHMLDPEAERRITINGVVAHPWLNRDQLVQLSYEEPYDTESVATSDTRL